MKSPIRVNGFVLQDKPRIYLTSVPGHWLLAHCTPSWRIKDPKLGFQRVVKDERAKAIAMAVLNQQRTFPNAVVLATDTADFEIRDGKMGLEQDTRFLVVDGQHRLWAQQFSSFEANYSCLIHCGLNEVQMAELFLEINDNQKRVPSSLRWDLVRLVRPEDDPYAVAATELVYEMATDEKSPLYQRIDLTGEQKEIGLKQGSIAPEIKGVISGKSSPLRDMDFSSRYELLTRYVAAIKGLDSHGWKTAESPFYQARVLRVLLKLLPQIIRHLKTQPDQITAMQFKSCLDKIDIESIKTEKIRAKQGVAGMKQIQDEISSQIFKKK